MLTQSTRKGRPYSARTPLFKSLRRLFGIATLANRKGSPPANELLGMPVRPGLSRRELLKSGAVAAIALGTGAWPSGCASPKTGPNAPRIAIVGGGIAGLNAAYKLKKSGQPATIYEAAKRTGGRIYTASDLLNPGLTTELGGEWVDSNHAEMLALAEEFGLEWLDMRTAGEEKLVREAYYFDGSHHTEAQVVDAFRPLAERIKVDFDKTGEIVDFENEGGAGELDRTSLADYFDRIGAQDWLGELLNVAFVTEFGLECNEQSSLNLIFMISTDLTAGKMELFGDSDERYTMMGGNQRIVDELAERVRGQIRLEHRLVALTVRGSGYVLTFDRGGRTTEVTADFVILTLPFTMLRQVELKVELPDWKRKAIAELGYGMNGKLVLGMKSRIWRDHGYSGTIFSDEAFQNAWDNSRLQPVPGGGITCYSGGKGTDALKAGSASDQARRMLAALDKPFPGLAAQFNGKAERFMWPTHPFTLGSYACYLPGQWTTIANAEGRPIGNLFFAGEHCSYAFQGYMNGGAETGKQAALGVETALRNERRKA